MTVDVSFGEALHSRLNQSQIICEDQYSGRRGGTSMRAVTRVLGNEDAVIEHLFACREAALSVCPQCGERVKLYRTKGTRRFSGYCCKDVYRTVTTGTLFDASTWPLASWILAMNYFANFRGGVSTWFLQTMFGLGKDSAYKIASRIRCHMALLECDRQVGGPGVPVALSFERIGGARGKDKHTQPTLVLAIHDATQVVTAVVPDRRLRTIGPIIMERVQPGSVLVYRTEIDKRRLCGHRAGGGLALRFELAPDGAWPGLNDVVMVFWMHFRRVMAAGHVHFAKDKLWQYLGEFCFRFNRSAQPDRIFWDMVARFPQLPAEMVRPPRRTRRDGNAGNGK